MESVQVRHIKPGTLGTRPKTDQRIFRHTCGQYTIYLCCGATAEIGPWPPHLKFRNLYLDTR
jgi:hypothetical protein